MAIACNNSFFWVTLVSLKDFRHEGLSWDFCRIQTLVDQDLPVYTRVGIIVLLLEAFFQSGPDFPLIELSWYWGGVVGASFCPTSRGAGVGQSASAAWAARECLFHYLVIPA
jgi:hypothetical protein